MLVRAANRLYKFDRFKEYCYKTFIDYLWIYWHLENKVTGQELLFLTRLDILPHAKRHYLTILDGSSRND